MSLRSLLSLSRVSRVRLHRHTANRDFRDFGWESAHEAVSRLSPIPFSTNAAPTDMNTHTTRRSGICPSFKDHSLSPLAEPVTIRNSLHRCTSRPPHGSPCVSRRNTRRCRRRDFYEIDPEQRRAQGGPGHGQLRILSHHQGKHLHLCTGAPSSLRADHLDLVRECRHRGFVGYWFLLRASSERTGLILPWLKNHENIR